MTLPFIGPSYSLATRKADVQRTVNMFPVMNEVVGGKTPAYLQQVPGLDLFSAGAIVNDLSVVKTQSLANASVGSVQTYTVVATNRGPDAADGGTITDILPAALTFTSCSIAYSAGTTGPATATAGALAAGIVITAWPDGGTATLTIIGTFNDAGNIVNTVTATVKAGNFASGSTHTSSVTTPVTLPWILISNFESPDTGVSVTDESVLANTPTTYADTYDEPGTQVTASNAKFGTQSWGVVYAQSRSFSNRTLVYPLNSAYALPGDFTLVYWVWPDGSFSQYYPDIYCAAPILDFSANPHVQWGTWLLNLHLNTYIDNVSHGGLAGAGGINTLTAGVWNLVEISRQVVGGSATLRTFVNGVKSLEEACSNATLAAQEITVSGFVKNGITPNVYAGGGATPKCYDSIGLVKGLVLHTNSYTPPTVPYTRTMTLAQTGV